MGRCGCEVRGLLNGQRVSHAENGRSSSGASGVEKIGKKEGNTSRQQEIPLAKSCEGRYCEPAEKGVGLQIRK